jgi:hypothetical protein
MSLSRDKKFITFEPRSSTKGKIVDRLTNLKQSLVNHQLFDELTSIEGLQIFMEHHVACVWDFMQLLKNLQGHFCPSGAIWSPPKCSLAARLINDIVLYEESDEDFNNSYSSHFEMYLSAMKQVGANTSPIERLLIELERGVGRSQALKSSGLPKSAVEFSTDTLTYLDRPIHEQVGIFVHSREVVISDLFIKIVDSLIEGSKTIQSKAEENLRGDSTPSTVTSNFDDNAAMIGIAPLNSSEKSPCSELHYYLKRHIFIDATHHGPMAERLLDIVCNDDVEMHMQAIEAARQALLSRHRLWDAISLRLKSKNEDAPKNLAPHFHRPSLST